MTVLLEDLAWCHALNLFLQACLLTSEYILEGLPTDVSIYTSVC